MAVLVVQRIIHTGLTPPTYAAAAGGGDSFVNDGRTFLHVKNAAAGGNSIVTINSLVNCDQGVDHNLAVTIADASESMIGPFAPSRFNDANGSVAVTYSEVTGVTVAVLQLSQNGL